MINEKKRKLPSWITDPEPDNGGGSVPAPKEARTEPSFGSERESEKKEEEDDEDHEDYLNMTIEDTKSKKTSLLSAREQLERQKRGNADTRNKRVTSADHTARSTALDQNDHALKFVVPPSKGAIMLQQMGYTSGKALGTNGRGLLEPLKPAEAPSGVGLGFANEQKRKIVSKAETVKKQVLEEQTEYRDSIRSEIDEKRIGGRIFAAQKVCETLDTQAAEDAAAAAGRDAPIPESLPDLKHINVLWRSRAIYRKERERERLLRQQMLDSAMTFSGRQYNDDYPSMNKSEAASDLRRLVYEEDGEEDEEDPELSDFEALDAQERLDKILAYLREKHCYCFWCGCKYTDKADLQNCPGLDEEDHE